MLREHLMGRGLRNLSVLKAMRDVPRHLFVPEAMRNLAYEDCPLPIGFGQSISQPFIVACMSILLDLRPGMKVLEVGTGSGYQAAILASMGARVYSIERIPELHKAAAERFRRMGTESAAINLFLGDGTFGLPDYAPFDRILVTAGGPDIPEPLVMQMADPGIMVIPVGNERNRQRIVRVFYQNGKYSARASRSVSFVELLGEHGWHTDRTHPTF
ncbi:MAG: protein-L-isoaspartate(D-aspartate) O-methyltransferase [Desulfovibrionaceae bacterium]|nr:protein-L-isoaspartate(D-aspartate) O-methyltransferase [Desulfovibrionaceae bacterium]